MIYLDGTEYVDSSIYDKINYLKKRAREIMLENEEDGICLDKLFRLINLLPERENK